MGSLNTCILNPPRCSEILLNPPKSSKIILNPHMSCVARVSARAPFARFLICSRFNADVLGVPCSAQKGSKWIPNWSQMPWHSYPKFNGSCAGPVWSPNATYWAHMGTPLAPIGHPVAPLWPKLSPGGAIRRPLGVLQ